MITRVAATGHRPDSFIVSHYSPETIQRIIEDVIFVVRKQYDNDILFNVGGTIGTDQWVVEACIKLGVNYKLYLPFPAEIQSRFWSKKDKQILEKQISKAYGIEIVDPSGNYHVSKYQERNKRMVDDGDFVLAFWVGKRKGGTYNCMKYALKTHKLVYNALDENSLVDNRVIDENDLIKGWIPPTLRGEI